MIFNISYDNINTKRKKVITLPVSIFSFSIIFSPGFSILILLSVVFDSLTFSDNCLLNKFDLKKNRN